jgi:hypothetical protein
MKPLLSLLQVIIGAVLLAGCSTAYAQSAAGQASNGAPVVRRGFLGAFFRPQGAPPFGVFAAHAKQVVPSPYPSPRSQLFGAHGYCDEVASNGVSISSGYPVDENKLADIVGLHVKWTRTPAPSFFDDRSHMDSNNKYQFADFDSAQCGLLRHDIVPLIALEDGPVMYNANSTAGGFSPKEQPHYQTAGEFADWCGVVATHERQIFPSVYRFSLPGNEVNSNPQMFPAGEAQVAQYSEACYKAIKRANPKAVVYGFELNMDGNLNPAAFVQRMYDLGCKPGVCYDAISMHLSLRYPIPRAATPCYPHPGGDYSLQCIADVRNAAHAPIHVIIGETGYFVPGNVPDEAAKANATIAAFQAFAADPYVDGVSYANVDECDLYPSGYFADGCLIDAHGNKLPAYSALQRLAVRAY